MIQGGWRASAPVTAGPRPDSSSLPPPARPLHSSARLGRGGGRGAPDADPAAEALVRRSAVASCVRCGICGGLLSDATAFAECLDVFCRKCICDKYAKENITSCPTCGIHLGCSPLEKLRSVIFPAKRRKVVTTYEKRNEKVSAESTLSLVVDVAAERSTPSLPPAASQSQAQKIEVKVIDEDDETLKAQESVYEPSTLNLAPVGRDALSRIRCRDFYSACHLSVETGALIVWQPTPILREIVAHDQLAPRQDPDTFGSPVISDTEYQRQAPAVQLTNTSVVAGSSFHPRMTVQDDENLRGDIFDLFNETNARIMGRYHAHISQLKAENSKLREECENERTAALERTRILEQRHGRESGNEKEAAAEGTRVLQERLQRELED